MSIPDYIDRKTQAPAVEDATLFTGRTANLNEGGQSRAAARARRHAVVLLDAQRQPFLGRGIHGGRSKPDADKFVILTHGLWTSRYGARRVDRRPRHPRQRRRAPRGRRAAADFELPAATSRCCVPFAFTPAQMSDNGRGNEFSQMIARLRPGASIAQLNEQMKVITERDSERLPARAAFMKTSQFGGFAVSMRDQLVGDVRTPL